MTESKRIVKTLRYMATYGMLEQIYKDALLTAAEMLEEKSSVTYEPRYAPGYWNGINGGTHNCLYFDMDDVNRVNQMTETVIALREYGIRYVLSKLKRRYRIAISKRDYINMSDELKARIRKINYQNSYEIEECDFYD